MPFGPKAAVLGVNGRGGGIVQLWDDPIAQTPTLGTAEKWQLWNWSADAHPIHIHLVKFRVMSRQVDRRGVRGRLRPPSRGWKDTVIAYPGEVTTVAAKFDLPGLYVWHCHILEHEDNEMMVPFCVEQRGRHARGRAAPGCDAGLSSTPRTGCPHPSGPPSGGPFFAGRADGRRARLAAAMFWYP